MWHLTVEYIGADDSKELPHLGLLEPTDVGTVQNQHEYGQMSSIMTLLQLLSSPSTLIPYEQYYIQTLHQEGKNSGTIPRWTKPAISGSH